MADAIVGPLLSKLQDVAVTEAKALAAVGGEIENLSDKLMWLQALVHEIDLRSRHDGSRLIRVLACQIREVAFEAEDAVDQFYLKGDLSRRFGLSQRFGRNWVRAAVEFIVNFRTHICVRFILSSRIRSLNTQLEGIINNSSKYGMVQASSSDGMSWRPSRGIPLMRDNWENWVPFKLIGRQKEESELKKMLKSGPNVINVVGVGGIGKRAFLKRASEDKGIKEDFPLCVRVSFPPGIGSTSILHRIEEKLDKEWSLFNKSHHQKACCLVIIDSPIRTPIWNKVEPKLLERIGQGSKILLSKEESWHEQINGGAITLGTLTKDQIKPLFNHVVGLGGKRKSKYCTEQMDTIRYNIEQVTQGLPLAVVLLAKFMTTMAYSKWKVASEYIRRNHEDNLLKTILTVCIDDLPDELKSCLLYTAGFPENSIIDAHKLVRLWMSEGFLTRQQGLEAEQLGQCYLKELIYRGLLQLINKISSADGGRVESVTIHGQIHSLLISEAQRTGFMDFHYGGCIPPPANTRRLALYKCNDKFSAPSSCLDKLRTMVFYSDDNYCMDHEKASNPENKSSRNRPTLIRKLLRGSPFLCVLDLEGLNLGPELPEDIGEMVHLQYLGVRRGSLKKLPSSVGNLGRLQTVDVRGTEVRELPKSLWKIQTLRHVLGDSLRLPRSTGDLELLQTLETVTIQHVHNVHKWCVVTGKRKKQFGLRFLHKLRIVELKKSQKEDLKTILKDLSYLENLGLSTHDIPGDDIHDNGIPIDLFAGASSVVGVCLDHVASLELDGKLPDENLCFSCVPNCLSSLTRLVLRRTNIKQNFIHVIAKLPTLAELDMQSGSYVGEEVVFCNHGFHSLAVLRITSLVHLKRITVHTVTTRRNKAIEPKCFDMFMAKFNNFEPNTSCSFCNTTNIRGQVDMWQHPPAVGNNPANGGEDGRSRNDQRRTGEADEQAAPMASLPSYREMILKAIDKGYNQTKMVNKSTKTIQQYINKNYLQLVADEKEIEEQLEKMRESGDLIVSRIDYSRPKSQN